MSAPGSLGQFIVARIAGRAYCIAGFPLLTRRPSHDRIAVAMHESPGVRTDDPYALPGDTVTRRMAISTLAYRAIAQKREVQLNDVLGEPAADLLSDLMVTVANETSMQLMLTEHLLKQG